LHYLLLQDLINWIEVDKSKLLYDVNVGDAAGHLYGVAVSEARGRNGPIRWISCLYDSSQRKYLKDMYYSFNSVCMR